MPVTVLHLITGLGLGGAERQLARIVSRPFADIRPVVVAMTEAGEAGLALERAGVTVESLAMTPGRPDVRALKQLVRLIRRERPAVLQTWLYHADLLGLIAKGFVRPPRLVWNLRCSEVDFSQYSRLSSLVVKVLAKSSRFPAAVIHNSLAGRAAHEALGYRPKRWIHIPNGFDLEEFAPRPEARDEVRLELGFTAEAPLVGLVARFDPMKDHAAFLAAAAKLIETRPDVRFLFAGAGTDPANRALVEKVEQAGLTGKVALLGRRDDVARLNAALDLAVSASAFGEGFPNSLGEALCAGICCVATEVGDSAALVGSAGLTVPPRNPEALARAMEQCLSWPAGLRRALGADARARMAENYSLSAIAGRYAALYRELGDIRED